MFAVSPFALYFTIHNSLLALNIDSKKYLKNLRLATLMKFASFNFFFFDFLCLHKIPGIFSNSLDEAHLIIPRKVNSDGELMSHILNHHHEHDHYVNGTGDSEDHTVHYQIDLHNETLHLEME